MKVPYSERVAIYTGPESCAGGCETKRKALTGVRIGPAIERRKFNLGSQCSRSCRRQYEQAR